MPIQTATPYLILHGKAERAIALYEQALGAKTEVLQRFGDVQQSCPAAMKDLVMHALLKIGNATLMLSDGPGEGPLPPTGIVSVALDVDDPEVCRRSFEALAKDGKVVQPLFDAPWGSLFGAVHDAFGVSWMFDCAKKPGP